MFIKCEEDNYVNIERVDYFRISSYYNDYYYIDIIFKDECFEIGKFKTKQEAETELDKILCAYENNNRLYVFKRRSNNV